MTSLLLVILTLLLTEFFFLVGSRRPLLIPGVGWRIFLTLLFIYLLESGTLVVVLHEPGATL